MVRKSQRMNELDKQLDALPCSTLHSQVVTRLVHKRLHVTGHLALLTRRSSTIDGSKGKLRATAGTNALHKAGGVFGSVMPFDESIVP
jgi:hypothetical protein